MKRDINYDSMYLKDILATIDKAAMELMMPPRCCIDDADHDIDQENRERMWQNEGVRYFREILVDKFTLGEDEDDE